MCGLAIYVGAKPLRGDVCRAVLDSMRHRGPDSEGMFQSAFGKQHLVMFHSRLAIIDLNDRSKQPFCGNGFVVVLNGEIYNFIELRAEMKKKGVQFRTNSDTEVVLEAYRLWGEHCFKKFEGMWALLIFDQNNRKIVVSRDRFGEKPLFYIENNGQYFFASEIKTLAAMRGEWPEICDAQVRRFLVNGPKALMKNNHGWYKGVREFPKAHFGILLADGNIEKIKYWSVKQGQVECSYSDAVAETRRLLIEAVNMRLRSDVPVCFCLSGGIDSASLASVAVKKFNKKIITFSIVDEDPRYDETKFIDCVVNDLECENHKFNVADINFWERMSCITRYHGFPISSISYLVHSSISQAVSVSGHKVVISGTGADELFTGYYDHSLFWLAQMADERPLDDLIHEWDQKIGKYVRNPFLKNPMLFRECPSFRSHIYLNSEKFNEFMLLKCDECFTERLFTRNPLRNRMMNELFEEIVPIILQEDDLNSMAFSVENRSPFLDTSLCEFAFSIPDRHLMRDGYSKAVLRDAVDGYLHDKVRLNSEKRGFNASISSLLRLNDKMNKEIILQDNPVYDYVDRSAIRRLLDEPYLTNSYSKFLFNVIALKIFFEVVK